MEAMFLEISQKDDALGKAKEQFKLYQGEIK